jgi:hypothetical protein
MDTHPNGVPFDEVNAISATTTGVFDIFMATIHRHCSPLLTSTLVISLAITTTSSFAPAACELFHSLLKRGSNFHLLLVSARSKLIDVDNSTFLIGALPENCFIKDTGYVVDILVAQKSHFRQIWEDNKSYYPPAIGFNYGLG